MQGLQNRWYDHRKINVLILICALISIIWTANNQSLYHHPIGRVESVKVIHREKQTDQFHNVDYLVKQRLKMRVMNGHYRGRQVTALNTYSRSGGMDQQYRVGQQAFLTQLSKSHGQFTANVAGLKRDTTIVIMTWLVLLLLVCFLGRKGIVAFVSAALNALLFGVAIRIDLQTQAQYIVPIFAILSFVMAAITLCFVFGWTKQTFATLGATVLGVAIAVGTFLLVSALTNERGIYYEAMQFVTENYRLLYLAEVMVGCLGAVMDESSDILATMFEVKRITPTMSWHTLYLAGKNVGKTVMGPLTNILLMIFLFSTLTNAVLMLRNGNSWGYTFSMCMSLGVAQSLVSGIGIVITVPVVSLSAALLMSRK